MRSETPSKAVRGAEDDAVVMSPFHLNWKEKEPAAEEAEARSQREREELLSRVDRCVHRSVPHHHVGPTPLFLLGPSLTNLVAKMEEQMRAKDSELAELRSEVATLKAAPRVPRTTVSLLEAPPPPRLLAAPKIGLPAYYPVRKPHLT